MFCLINSFAKDSGPDAELAVLQIYRAWSDSL